MPILWNLIRKIKNNVIYNNNNIYIGINTKIIEEYFLNVILQSGEIYLNLTFRLNQKTKEFFEIYFQN